MADFKNTLFDLSGKVAIITGSTKGMGRAMAQRFIQHGAKVTVSSRSQIDCDKFTVELNSEAGEEVSLGVAADLLDVASLRALVDRTVEKFGRVDIVICNAAILSFGKEGDVDADEFSDVLIGNIRNNFVLCNHALPYMRKVGAGSIILVGSQGAGLRPSDSMSVYAIAKRGLMQMAENMALYLGPDNIRVNSLCPGFIRTEGSKPFWSDPTSLKIGSAATVLNRPGEGDDIAGCALFLASAAGNYTTGQTIAVDGGQMLVGGISNSLKADVVYDGLYQRKS